MSKNKILLTRPKFASEKLARILAERGFESVIDPLLIIELIAAKKPQGEFEAVMITSAHIAEAAKSNEWIEDYFNVPCFCVGETTGQAALELGFKNVKWAENDSAALAHKIISENINIKNILHLCGEITDEKAKSILQNAGINLISCPVYRALAAEDFSKLTRDALRANAFLTIPLFSPRSAKIFVSLLEKNGLTERCSSLTVIALSQAVADVLGNIQWNRMLVAAAPSEAEVLICIGNAAHDTDRNAT